MYTTYSPNKNRDTAASCCTSGTPRLVISWLSLDPSASIQQKKVALCTTKNPQAPEPPTNNYYSTVDASLASSVLLDNTAACATRRYAGQQCYSSRVAVENSVQCGTRNPARSLSRRTVQRAARELFVGRAAGRRAKL